MTLYCPPNFKTFDRPPTKKPRVSGTAATAPNVHIAVNFSLMPEASHPAMKGSYTVSNSPIEATSVPGPSQSCPANVEVSDTAVEHHSAPGPVPRPQPYRPRGFPTNASLIPMLLECLRAKRVPTTHELLALMDAYDPAEDLRYVDALSEMEDHEMEDALHVYSLNVGLLASLGNLGSGNAGRLHRFTRDNILEPLGFLETVREDRGIANTRDSVEVVSIDDNSVDLVAKKEDSEPSGELVIDSGGSVELVAEDTQSVAEEMSDDTHASVPISRIQYQETQNTVLRWMEGVDRGDSENEYASVLLSDADEIDVAVRHTTSVASSHEV